MRPAIRLTNVSDQPVPYLLVRHDPIINSMEKKTLGPGHCGYLVELSFHDNGTARGKGALVTSDGRRPPIIVLEESDMPAFVVDLIDLDDDHDVAHCRETTHPDPSA